MSGLCLLASYPKSGNTWMRIALASLGHGGAPVELGSKYQPGWHVSDAALLASIISNRNWFDEYVGVESSKLTCREIDRLRGGGGGHSLNAPGSSGRIWR